MKSNKIFKLSLMLILALYAAHALPQKLLLASFNDGEIFLEQSSLKQVGNYKEAILFYEFQAPKSGSLSMITDNIYDCISKRYKSKKLVMYAEHEGKGNVTISNDDGDEEWIYPLLNTSGFDIVKYICKNN